MDELKQQIKQLMITELDLRDRAPSDIDEAAPLFGAAPNGQGLPSLGLDSLDALQLAMAIEERFGVRIPEGEEARGIFASVDSIAQHIQKVQRSAEPTQ